MARHGKRKKSRSSTAGRPLYHAQRKKKAKFPPYLKKYYKCCGPKPSAKRKAYCKKHTPGYPK